MTTAKQKIIPNLWFDRQAEEAAHFYTSLFKNSRIGNRIRAGKAGFETHGLAEDHYWEKLTADGGQESMCGWLKDKYGVSWQVAPAGLDKMLRDPDQAKVERVTNAFLKMRKFDLTELQKAYKG